MSATKWAPVVAAVLAAIYKTTVRADVLYCCNGTMVAVGTSWSDSDVSWFVFHLRIVIRIVIRIPLTHVTSPSIINAWGFSRSFRPYPLYGILYKTIRYSQYVMQTCLISKTTLHLLHWKVKSSSRTERAAVYSMSFILKLASIVTMLITHKTKCSVFWKFW